MIQTFVVLYSILIYAGGTDYEEAISHGLHFGSYEECNLFFNKNQKHLLAGAEDYGERRYNYDMEVQEIGCATMSLNQLQPDDSKITDYRTLWSKH